MTRVRQCFLVLFAGLLVTVRVFGAEDCDPEAEPPPGAETAMVTERPTISTAPPRLRFGKTAEEQGQQFRAWLLKTYPNLDPECPAVAQLIRSTVQEIQPIDGGEPAIYEGGYGYKSAKFNECQAMADVIHSIPAPRDYRDEVLKYYAWGLIDQRWTIDAVGEKARLKAIKPSNNVVRLKPGEKLRPHIAKVFSGLAKCTPLMQKLVFDYVALINPNTIEPQGWYRSSTAKPKETADHVALPVGNGRFQVCRYVIKPNAAILIPAPQSLAEAANPKKLNVRGYWIQDLGSLAGLTPIDLDISYTQIREIGGLAGMKSVRRLKIAGLPVSDLSPLAGLPLDALDITDTGVVDLSAIKALRLKELRMDRTGVSSLAPLEGMPLKVLSFEQTDVSDLAPLAGMPLTYVNLDVTRVRDLSPLEGMPLKEVLYAPGKYKGLAALRQIKTLQVIGFHPADEWRTNYDKKHLKKGTKRAGPTTQSEPGPVESASRK